MAGKSALQALTHAKTRADALQRSFADQETFDCAWERGRYLQFCGLIESAHDRCDSAWSTLKAEIEITAAHFCG